MNSSLYRIQPFAHQFKALEFVHGREFYALLMEQGTGKTPVIIHDALRRWGAGAEDAVLVMAPNGVHANWVLRELPKHTPEWAQWRAAAWYSSPNRTEANALERLFDRASGNELRWLTMNWEALTTRNGLEMARRFAQGARRLFLVGDESQRFKNPKAKRTRALFKLRHYSTARAIMSGTAVLNSPWDAFSQFTYLDDMLLRTTSYSAFKAEYAELLPDGHGLLKHIAERTRGNYLPQVVARDKEGRPRWRNLDKLNALIDPISFRVLKKDCLDLPSKVYTQRFFRMTPTQQKLYTDVKKDLKLQLSDGTLAPIVRIAALTKLSQIVSGYFIAPGMQADDPTAVHRIFPPENNPKLKMLVDEIEDAINERGQKVIVWARFRIEHQDIEEALRRKQIRVVTYHGGTSRADRSAAIDEFQDGMAQVFLGQQAAGGTGITLTSAEMVIYYSNTWSLEDRVQSEDRAHRIGQTRTVTYLDLAAQGTIDERIVMALQNKQDLAAKVMGDSRQAEAFLG